MFSLRVECSATRIVILPQGDVKEAAVFLRQLGSTWRHTEPRGGLQAPLAWATVCQLLFIIRGVPNVTIGPRLRQWIAEQKVLRTTVPDLTSSVNKGAPPPRDYQVRGAQMIAAMKRALLLDEMGVGKTLTALLGVTEILNRGELDGPTLVVAPNSTVDDWVASAWRWTPFHARAYRGASLHRRKMLPGNGNRDLLVCGYGLIANDLRDMVEKLQPAALVVDEVHWCKDESTWRSKAVRAISETTQVFVGLSGTPITHRAKGLWSALYCIDHLGWPTPKKYEWYLNSEGDLYKKREPVFRASLKGQNRRVAKEDVLTQLPPKIHSVRNVHLPPAARRAYQELESGLAAEVEGGRIEPMGILAALLRMNQLASATGTVVEDQDGNPQVKLRAPSWKVDALLEILQERDGQQTVVFAPSRQLIDIAGEKVHQAGYRVGYIVGGQKPADRTSVVKRFQDGELDVILATTSAGGIGITLTAASAVVFLQRPWSFVEAVQAEDRAHRIGSEVHESIDIIDIVASDTVDEYVRDTLRDKADSLAKLLEDPRIQRQCLGGK